MRGSHKNENFEKFQPIPGLLVSLQKSDYSLVSASTKRTVDLGSQPDQRSVTVDRDVATVTKRGANMAVL